MKLVTDCSEEAYRRSFGLRELLVELAGQHIEAGEQSVENSFGVERRDEFKTQSHAIFPRPLANPLRS